MNEKFYIRIGMKRQSSSNWQNWTAKQEFFLWFIHIIISKRSIVQNDGKRKVIFMSFSKKEKKKERNRKENNMKILHLFDICGFCIYFSLVIEADEHT